MKIGALNSSLRKPLSATVQKYAEMGIQGMQIQITPEHLIFSDARLREIRSICADAGLKQSEQTGEGKLDVSKKILVVDDVALNVKVLCAMLRKMGFDPLSASSGAKALDLMKTVKPDIALLDLWMPEMNGMELASAIRANPDWAGIRIYAVTADTENATNFDMSMFDSIVMKPVTQESLMKVLG